MEWNRDVDVRDGGYVRGGVGGGSTFIGLGVKFSSFFSPNLFTPNPVSQYSWFHQTIPNIPSSVLLFLCGIRNSLLNRLTFSAWISALRLILIILLFSACFFFIHNLSAMSSGSSSCMLKRHVSHCMIWTYIALSKVLGSIKKLLELKKFSPSSKSMEGGIWCFRERVFMAGGVITISAIGSNPRG